MTIINSKLYAPNITITKAGYQYKVAIKSELLDVLGRDELVTRLKTCFQANLYSDNGVDGIIIKFKELNDLWIFVDYASIVCRQNSEIICAIKATEKCPKPEYKKTISDAFDADEEQRLTEDVYYCYAGVSPSELQSTFDYLPEEFCQSELESLKNCEGQTSLLTEYITLCSIDSCRDRYAEEAEKEAQAIAEYDEHDLEDMVDDLVRKQQKIDEMRRKGQPTGCLWEEYIFIQNAIDRKKTGQQTEGNS